MSDRDVVRGMLAGFLEEAGAAVPPGEELVENLERANTLLRSNPADTKAFERWARAARRGGASKEDVARQNIKHIEAGGKYLSDSLYHFYTGVPLPQSVQRLIDARAVAEQRAVEAEERTRRSKHIGEVQDEAAAIFEPVAWRKVLKKLQKYEGASPVHKATVELTKFYDPRDYYVKSDRVAKAFLLASSDVPEKADALEYIEETLTETLDEMTNFDHVVDHASGKHFKIEVFSRVSGYKPRY